MEFFFGVAGLWFALEWIGFAARDDNSTDVPAKPKKHWWNSSGKKQSGLEVYVDQATGVHYVRAGIFDKLQVRINADGTPYTGE